MGNIVAVVKEKKSYPFKAVRLLNRLGMEIEIDICPVLIEDEMVMIIRSNHNFHRSVVEKSIEHIAFQLKEKYAHSEEKLIIVEHIDRHVKAEEPIEWRQWRFTWVGNSAMNASHHSVPSSLLNRINFVLFDANEELKRAS